MKTSLIPELALSDHESDNDSVPLSRSSSSSLPLRLRRSPTRSEKEQMDEMDRLRSEDRSSDVRAWNDGGWNDFALRDVWLTAKEEYQIYNNPSAPFRPFAVDQDFVALSRQKLPDSWKYKMQVKSQTSRQKDEAAGRPLPGVKRTSDLWYTDLSTALPKKAKKSSHRRATRQDSTDPIIHPRSPGSYRPLSPEPYTPTSPSPSSPEIGEANLMADQNGWDDSELVDSWEREKQAWQDQNGGTTKSWLDLAMEEQARRDAGTAASAPVRSPSSFIAVVEPSPVALDKVAKRNLARFQAIAGSSAGSEEEIVETLCYD